MQCRLRLAASGGGDRLSSEVKPQQVQTMVSSPIRCGHRGSALHTSFTHPYSQRAGLVEEARVQCAASALNGRLDGSKGHICRARRGRAHKMKVCGPSCMARRHVDALKTRSMGRDVAGTLPQAQKVKVCCELQLPVSEWHSLPLGSAKLVVSVSSVVNVVLSSLCHRRVRAWGPTTSANSRELRSRSAP